MGVIISAVRRMLNPLEMSKIVTGISTALVSVFWTSWVAKWVDVEAGSIFLPVATLLQ